MIPNNILGVRVMGFRGSCYTPTPLKMFALRWCLGFEFPRGVSVIDVSDLSAKDLISMW
jgi:hypothetical protein